MSKLVRHFTNFNKDYSDFLSLKGEVNIPMVRYPCQPEPCTVCVCSTPTCMSVLDSSHFLDAIPGHGALHLCGPFF